MLEKVYPPCGMQVFTYFGQFFTTWKQLAAEKLIKPSAFRLRFRIVLCVYGKEGS